MSSGAPNTAEPRLPVWNAPNQLSAARLVLSVLCFIAIEWARYDAALGLFLLAVATDWLDGYLARRYALITKLGRVLDPFADKVVVCGVFIYLVGVPDSGVPAWAAVVVVARELLVTALRSMVESGGGDFSARFAGKAKMVAQCVALALCLFRLTIAAGDVPPPWLDTLFAAALWTAVVLTVISGESYVRTAIKMTRTPTS